ncbi:amino acid adenylation domain-containing protein [Nocardioides speluncae]|uniref:amino acid adenylation domain-containing protein n=1 Tax=Nocardioides speluncae TaxID=2670337 RepID=UPI000D693B7C|nr:amino acid adenylation domain-containing protein [Nocardioides speluncae]
MSAHRNLIEAFDAQVAARPDAVAVSTKAGDTTYGVLAERSRRVAAHLYAAGVRPGDRVGVLTADLDAHAVAVLAVLRNGAAYVPLLPTDPAQRREQLLSLADIRLVVVGLGVDAELPVPTVVLADCYGAVADAPLAQVGPDDPAYVMFTSGSTGQPKGVVVPHRGVLHLVVPGQTYIPFGPELTFLQIAPITFDVSTFELWGAFVHGARCVDFPHRRPTPTSLRRTIAAHGIDTMVLTVALFNLIVDDDVQALAGLRYLIIGGEAVSVPHARAFLAAHPGCALINGYGPTECTTHTCSHLLVESELATLSQAPIGRPLTGTSVLVVDEDGRPVPAGVKGELLVGGPGVALGYCDPVQTKAAFMPAPDGGLLYRTGDVVSDRGDGVLEFHGRRDGQIKLRGYRIEPAEVEAALLADPLIARCSVGVVGEAHQRSLVARAVLRPEAGPDAAAEILARQRERVPAYLVPDRLEVVNELPLTTSGKASRRWESESV